MKTQEPRHTLFAFPATAMLVGAIVCAGGSPVWSTTIQPPPGFQVRVTTTDEVEGGFGSYGPAVTLESSRHVVSVRGVSYRPEDWALAESRIVVSRFDKEAWEQRDPSDPFPVDVFKIEIGWDWPEEFADPIAATLSHSGNSIILTTTLRKALVEPEPTKMLVMKILIDPIFVLSSHIYEIPQLPESRDPTLLLRKSYTRFGDPSGYTVVGSGFFNGARNWFAVKWSDDLRVLWKMDAVIPQHDNRLSPTIFDAETHNNTMVILGGGERPLHVAHLNTNTGQIERLTNFPVWLEFDTRRHRLALHLLNGALRGYYVTFSDSFGDHWVLRARNSGDVIWKKRVRSVKRLVGVVAEPDEIFVLAEAATLDINGNNRYDVDQLRRFSLSPITGDLLPGRSIALEESVLPSQLWDFEEPIELMEGFSGGPLVAHDITERSSTSLANMLHQGWIKERVSTIAPNAYTCPVDATFSVVDDRINSHSGTVYQVKSQPETERQNLHATLGAIDGVLATPCE